MDPIDRLLALERLGIKLGLDNIKALCLALGNPHDSFRAITVAGTNGKGSVTAMLDAALRAASYKAARFTSPHLVRLEERFVIGGRPVETNHLRDVAADVLAAADRLRASGGLLVHPTFFEATTAIAFELFRRAAVDVAVLEVGLGGRFDATCVADPVAAAITSIELDHERHLGGTRRQIAFEKAGVIKEGILVVTGSMRPECLAVVTEVGRSRRARLCHAPEGVRCAVRLESGRTLLDLETPRRAYGTIPLALPGRHQAENAVVTVRLLEELESVGLPVSELAIPRGLTTAVWPGRLQLVPLDGGRRLLLDGAHNPAGAAALAEYLREVHPGKIPLIFGAMRDKNTSGILERLIPCAERLIMTQSNSRRAAPAAALAAQARQLGAAVPVEVEPRLAHALRRALSPGKTVCAAGSLYLVGELLHLVEQPSWSARGH